MTDQNTQAAVPSQEQFSKLANAIRFLSMDAVEKAKSGHPGAPMGMADIATVLWREYMNHNPQDPNWINRDRFILSNGHGSMLIYSLLHLSGYDLSIEDLKQFRQLNSKTAGHPEYGHAPGIETTTGPLGQGFANAVGFALAEKTLAAQFNTEESDIIDHFTYVFLGDGCLMEGISHEAASLAGRLDLGKLICFYDDNNISIDGEVEPWFADNTPARFESYGWHVIPGVDGHNPEQIRKAIEEAQSVTDKATLICCKTTIGFGSPNKQGTESCHGAALGAEEIELTRKALNWSHEPFVIPEDLMSSWNQVENGQAKQAEWQTKFDAYKAANADKAAELVRRSAGKLPENWAEESAKFIAKVQEEGKVMASRKSSQAAIQGFAPLLPEFLGGSADLTGSNNTDWKECVSVNLQADGNYVNYGVREFGMSAIMNGIALHGGFLPFGGTFLVFMEYAHNAVRMAALMSQRVVFVYTHDSIGLGEDGPTHQPIEQLASLRATPNLETWRPCDGVESAISWQQAIERDGPSALVLSRQNLPHQARDEQTLENVKKGGYILRPALNGEPQVTLISTGSEVGLIVEAAALLDQEGINTQVVSVPCLDRFLDQDDAYRSKVVPKSSIRVAVEAGVAVSWYQLVGDTGAVIGMNSFGASAPAPELYKHFGFTAEAIVAKAKSKLQENA
ncbi:MAG: transketolase [Pseudomonadota bacterium]|nr:transketolase [Gammaproteobacteria bacterium]MEC8010827.1 transketolase [Pseudomonadota bacterium]HBF08065.1 transketolase [Gammaproteobacteria bacterium]|tara:strand:- start:94258 stop:96294 length:2037 start_codon:yes stop_codon:yes gene_type:complete